ncbi:MAG: glycosyltransferase family 39 protein [Anaerolineae bacterium]
MLEHDETQATHTPSPDATLQSIEDLTLAQALRVFLRQPRATARAVIDVLRPRSDQQARLLTVNLADFEDRASYGVQARQQRFSTIVLKGVRASLLTMTRTPLVGYTIAFLFVLLGNIILSADVTTRRTLDVQFAQGLPFILIGVLIWALTECLFNLSDLREWWHTRRTATTPESIVPPSEALELPDLPWYERIPIWRFLLALIATVLSAIVWFGTANNTFDTPIFYIWLLSVLAWAVVFAPLDFNLFEWGTRLIDRWRGFRWHRHVGVLLALLVIVSVAGYFRFHQLAIHPLEMTDDHVEKILDAGRVRDGARNIFFANNGGREPVQMYLIALASYLPGLGINHDTIKFVSAVESLLTIPILFWMAYTVFEGEPRRRRLLIALIASALLAVSYWHVAITRQGLRIPLTPLFVALNLIYLLRGIRHNRRSDFIIAGLILGFGLYTYQAVRMLPVVIVVAVAVAILFKARDWHQRLQYTLNLSVLVAISFSIFIPMFRYSVDYPELFWRRTTGRLLGDDVIQEERPDGTIIYRDATAQERLEAFLGNVPTIASNIRNVLLMFNWEGDVATISGVSNRPSMDVWSASLLLVGGVAWVSFALRRRDVVYWLIPGIAFIMLLPSALSIAFPHENPSHTRTSGAIPTIYLLASLPLAFFVEQVLSYLQQRRAQVIAFGVSLLVIGNSFNANRYLYFDVYPERYQESFNPYSDAGRYLYGYVLTGGAYGNAFLIGYQHWWSHRALGLEGGLEEFWPGGIFPYVDGDYSTLPIIQAIHTNVGATGTFQFQPQSDLLFFFSPEDEATAEALQSLFPNGTASERTTYNPNEPFMVYQVPALSEDGLQNWLREHPTQ